MLDRNLVQEKEVIEHLISLEYAMISKMREVQELHETILRTQQEAKDLGLVTERNVFITARGVHTHIRVVPPAEPE